MVVEAGRFDFSEFAALTALSEAREYRPAARSSPRWSEVPRHFFKVRLWDQQTLLDQLFHHSDRLDEEIGAEIPLKRIWTVVPDDADESG